MTLSDGSLVSNIRNLIRHYQKKDLKTAKNLAEIMTKKFPTNNLSWQILSLIFMSNGEINKAHEAIKNAVKINPNDYKALTNLGLILFKLGLNEESILTFKKVLQINKDNINSYVNLGAVYQKINNFKEAETNYLKAISINPNLPIIHNNLGNTLKDLNKIQEAESSFNKAIELDPNYKKAKENLNLLFQEKKILSFLNKKKFNKSQLKENPYIKSRKIEPDLISSLYKIHSTELNKTEGGPLFGNGNTTNYQLFSNNFKNLKLIEKDLIKIMKDSVDSDIYIAESFLNILREDSGSFPHNHILPFDINNNLINRKYSLVYYISVGDQKNSKPGLFKLENPEQEFLPKDGTIIIIPASRIHSATYNGKTDRLMIGVNFYSLN